MKKRETSIFTVFQDPLLTIVALILIGTLWIIIPSEESGSTQAGSIDLAKLQKDIGKLKEEIKSIDERTDELDSKMQKSNDNIRQLSKRKTTNGRDVAIDILEKRIEELNRLNQSKRAELERMEEEAKGKLKERQAAQLEAVARLLEEITKLKQSIFEKEIILGNLEEELKNAKQEVESQNAEVNREINDLTVRISNLSLLIQKQEDELKRLEKELEKAKEALKEEQNRVAQGLLSMIEEIEKLKQEVAENEARLKDIRSKSVSANTDLREKAEREKTEERVLNDLQKQIDEGKKRIDDLKSIEKSLRESAVKYSSDAVGNRDGIAFEVFNNSILPIDEDNYDVAVYQNIQNSSLVRVIKLDRKKSARGDSLGEIEKSDSKFQLELKGKKTEDHYVYFIVRKDSFEAFLKAREIAWKNGFLVGWTPWQKESLYMTHGTPEVGER